jgi:UDP-N-acetylmuramoyl-tripeptide--D-alanyl-D-alanine ligase
MSGMSLCLGDAVQALNHAQIVGDGALVVERVHSDTRTLQRGDLFVALKGERFDGAQFLKHAKESGAVAAICAIDAEAQLNLSGLAGILVPDVKQALGELARFWRRRYTGPLVAVTGSNGKTTVTQMVASILHGWQGHASLATKGNFNNDIGLPLTLLRLRPEHRVAVVELGMNHPGEIAYLASVAEPTVALVNNAQREHQEFMASVEAVAVENGGVLSALPDQGVAVFPAEDAYSALWRRMAAASRCVLFDDAGTHADVALKDAHWMGDHWQANAMVLGKAVGFELHVAGRHNIKNALAALACAAAVGAPLNAMSAGLTAFRPVNGRSRAQVVQLHGQAITLIDDTYNANPDSVRAIIDVLSELPGKSVLVLGDMGEVGNQGPEFHAEMGDYARERNIGQLLTFGPLSAHAAVAFGGGRHFESVEDLNRAVYDSAVDCNCIAVKGSRFMAMERVIYALLANAAPAIKGAAHVA